MFRPEEGGLKPVTVDLEDSSNIPAVHECPHVDMPEPWTGENFVDFFRASDFIWMLRESKPAWP